MFRSRCVRPPDGPRSLPRHAHERGGPLDDLEALRCAAEPTFGAHAHTVRRALALGVRRSQLVQRIVGAQTGAERLLLAALHLGEDRSDIDAILAICGADATVLADTIRDWTDTERALQEQTSQAPPEA